MAGIRFVLALSLFALLGSCAHHSKCDKKKWKHKKFEKHDVNGDGEITKKEFDAHHEKMFKRWDKNDDGKVTKDEMSSACGKKSCK